MSTRLEEPGALIDFVSWYTPKARFDFITSAFLLNHLTVPGDAFIYILEFEGGIVKVGQTCDYAARYKSHRTDVRLRPRRIISEWRQPTARALEDERELKRFAKELGGTPWLGREWFSGVDRAALWDRAEQELEPELDPPMTSARFDLMRDAVVKHLFKT